MKKKEQLVHVNQIQSNNEMPVEAKLQVCHFDNQRCHISQYDNQNLKIMLRIVPVLLGGFNGRVVETFVLLDEASTVSLIEEKLADELGLEGETVPLCLQWTSDIKNKEMNSRVVSLMIRGKYRTVEYKIDGVRTVKNVCLPSQYMNVSELKKK